MQPLTAGYRPEVSTTRTEVTIMQYRIPTSARQYRKIATARAAAAGLVTAAQLMNGAGLGALADRFAGQITKAATAAGTTRAAVVFSKVNGRARSTAAYRVTVGLVAALGAYRPSLKAAFTAKGAPSKSKAADRARKSFAEYVRAFFGRTPQAPARVRITAGVRFGLAA